MDKRWLATALVTIMVGVGVAVGCAIALAVGDIYLAGHGRALLGRPWIDEGSIHMSRADAIFCGVSLASALTAGAATWAWLGRRRNAVSHRSGS